MEIRKYFPVEESKFVSIGLYNVDTKKSLFLFQNGGKNLAGKY